MEHLIGLFDYLNHAGGRTWEGQRKGEVGPAGTASGLIKFTEQGFKIVGRARVEVVWRKRNGSLCLRDERRFLTELRSDLGS